MSTNLDKNNLEDIQLCVKILTNEYLNQFNANDDFENIAFELKCRKIASYAELLKSKAISKRICLKFFGMLFEEENMGKMAQELVKEKSLFIIEDRLVIAKALDELIETNPKAVKDYKKLNKRAKICDFFVGKLNAKFNDCAEPTLVNEIVLQSLKKLD